MATEPDYAETCQSPNVILGTEGDDTIVGTEGDDIMCAGGGNDTISGNGGNDIIFGGEGNDTLNGGAGNDELRGDEGDDLILGGVGDDFIWLDDGTDQGFGDSGNDDIWGGAEDDYVSGGSGADNLYGDGGLDLLLGGSGNDGLDGGEGTDSLQGDSGVDYCVRDSSDITLSSCFFDNKGPQLVSVAYDPDSKNMNAVTGTQRLRGRALITDPGAGVRGVSFAFSSLPYAKSPGSLSGENTSYSYEKSTSSQEFTIWSGASCEQLEIDNTSSGICLKSGTIQRGVWEFFAVLPKNMIKGTWVLSEFRAGDLALNQNVLTYDCSPMGSYFNCGASAKSLKNLKLAISFKQLEVSDSVSPKVTLLGVSGSRRQSSVEDYVRFRIGVSDLSGIKRVSLSSPYVIQGPTGAAEISASTPLCGEQTLDAEVCVEGLDLTNTVVQVPVRYNPAKVRDVVHVTKIFCVCALSMADSLGNEINFRFKSASNQAKALQLHKVYATESVSDDGDTWVPVIKSISFSTKKINTSTGEKTVIVTMTVSDKGVGFDLLSPRVSLYFARKDAGQGMILCRPIDDWTGNANLLTVKLGCIFPANYGSGRIYVIDYYLQDNSRRRNVLMPSESSATDSWRKLYITNG
jgi:hypothetical protein